MIQQSGFALCLLQVERSDRGDESLCLEVTIIQEQRTLIVGCETQQEQQGANRAGRKHEA